jgi:hypothetical protein
MPPKRPRDPAQLANIIIDIATGKSKTGSLRPMKDPAAVEQGPPPWCSGIWFARSHHSYEPLAAACHSKTSDGGAKTLSTASADCCLKLGRRCDNGILQSTHRITLLRFAHQARQEPKIPFIAVRSEV